MNDVQLSCYFCIFG